MAIAAERSAALNELADDALAAKRVAEEVARQDEEFARRADELRRQQEDEARAAATEWVKASARIAGCILGLCEAIRAQQEAGDRLKRLPGSMPSVSEIAARSRLGDHLGRALFRVYRSNHVGRVLLNSAGMLRTDDYAAGEHRLLEGLLDTVYPQMQKGKPNGADLEDPPITVPG